MSCKFYAIIPAAGIGLRFGQVNSDCSFKMQLPKQYQPLGQKPVLAHVLDRFLTTTWIDQTVVALNPNDEYFDKIYLEKQPNLLTTHGGDTRARSVFNALCALANIAKSEDWILVHDAVRPCLSARDLSRLKESIESCEIGGILANKINSTVKKSINGVDIERTVNRSQLYQALTPQMFRYEILLTSLKYCLDKDLLITDESQAIETLGFSPKLVEAQDVNLKITTPNDLKLASLFIESQEETFA